MEYFFTSVNNAYIPKAITLAQSLRRVYGDQAHITCMLSDVQRADIDYSAFDEVLTIDDLDLPVPSLPAWIFKHAVVELCTAVKPWAFKKIFQRHQAQRVIYMDPDTVAYSRLSEIETLLQDHPIILTPHVTVPAQDTQDLLDGEMLGCLRHGVFNLGFLALSCQGEGSDFLDWWAARCLDWCYDDGPRGLFTDQRWVDLAPCFFPSLLALRHPGYNMATWNLYYRQLSRDDDGTLWVNGDQPLRFFHFSGHDLGTHLLMLEKHAPGDTLLQEMNQWYIQQENDHGHERLGRRPGAYDFYADGTSIPRQARVLYRDNADLMQRYPNPYNDPGYQIWFERESATESDSTAKPATTTHTLLAAAARCVRSHPRLLLWLNRTLPPSLQAKIRRRLNK